MYRQKLGCLSAACYSGQQDCQRTLELMQLFVVTLMLLLNTCGDLQSMTEVPLNRKFDLRFHEPVLVQKEQIAIEFSSLLQDSRCPKGDQCTTQGNATIELKIKKANQEAWKVQL